ncbi:MAG: hypothetical protein EB084_23225 [Proteobacteria bacterium]|nr:hypothetical protein [Pseudomonadota bacterium]
MAKIQLTLATEYVRNWSAWEGVREIIQNALDADQDGFKMEVTHSGSTLRVMSRDARLKKDVWLMGTTSKESGEYRGHFGEGLKLGVLALVRAGHDVKIINRDETWSPRLEDSEVFSGRAVLTIHTRQRENDVGGFVVEIGGVEKSTWQDMSKRFLAFIPQDDADVVDTFDAKVLLAPAMKGSVFVKGIFVQHDKDLSVGYDFKRLETDRDRRMVDSYDLKYHAGQAWAEAMKRTAVSPSKVLELMVSGAPDLSRVGSMYGQGETAKALGDAFVEKHGAEAIPVANMAEAREVEHYGKVGVVVPQGLVEALKNLPPMNLTTVREDFKKATQKTYGWSDLTGDERANYTEALGMVERAAADLGYRPVENRLTVVDFGDEGLLGLHEGGGAAIKIARKLLADFDETLRVLVHEVAHDKGGDGEKSHERAEGRLFARIVSNARKLLPAPAPVIEAPRAASVEEDAERRVAEANAILANPNATDADVERAMAILAGE